MGEFDGGFDGEYEFLRPEEPEPVNQEDIQDAIMAAEAFANEGYTPAPKPAPAPEPAPPPPVKPVKDLRVDISEQIKRARARAIQQQNGGLGAPLDVLQGGMNLIQGKPLLGKILVRTQVSPDIASDLSAQSQPGAPGKVSGGDPVTNALMGYIKPAFYAQTAAGPIAIEPWGRPDKGGTLRSAVFGASVLIFTGLAIYGGVSLALKLAAKYKRR